MPSTYTKIITTTLSSNTSEVEIASIPNTYSDLVLVVSGTTTGNANVRIRFNYDNTNSYIWHCIGATTGIQQILQTSQTSLRLTYPALFNTDPSSRTVHINDYANTSKYKTILSRGGSSAGTDISTGTWLNTDPIYGIYVSTDTQNFAVGTVFTLYGILKG